MRNYECPSQMVIPSIMHYALRIMNLFNDNLRRLIAVSHHINPF